MCAEENVVVADKLMSSGREDTKEQWDRTSGRIGQVSCLAPATLSMVGSDRLTTVCSGLFVTQAT